MNELYNENYYHNYCGPIPYEDAEIWEKSFSRIADCIIADLHPKTVLDAGCAMGYLVAALRDRGVEAYGVDISEYAISKVREDVRPYCAAGSLTEPLPEALPRHYDLVVTIEVLEHLYAEDGKKAIANLCSYADSVIFSSTPDDYEEATHVNVQQREYWARLFAENGFMDDLLYRPTCLPPYAVLYRRRTDWPRQVEDYERILARYMDKAAGWNQEWFCKLYFDMGTGADEAHCTSLPVEPGKRFAQHIVIPQGCKSVRFDPVEGAGCLIWDVKARTEVGSLPIKACNGILLGDAIACKPNDPQIYFEAFASQPQYLELSAEILPLNQDGWLYLCEALHNLSEEHAALHRTLDDRNSALDTLQQQLAEKDIAHQQQLAEKDIAQQQQLAEMEADAEICRGQLEKLQSEVDACRHEIQEYSNLVAYERGEAAKVAAAYQAISTSTFWKLTKPARVLLDLFKKLFIFPLRKVRQSIKTVGKRETLRKIKRKLTGAPQPAPAPQAFAAASVDARRNPVTLDPIDGIETFLVDEDVKRLNLVTDTIDASSLLGGVATALIVATEFANRNGYELRIITRKTETNPVNYANIMRISGIEPARKLSFYSDYERFSKPVDFRMELGRGEIFFATSWWSAQAIKNTTIRPRFFYIIQEVETFFYNYGGERLLCEQIMNDPNVDFIINSHYLRDYFAQHTPNITDHGCYFEPAFPAGLYSRKVFAKKGKYKLFFYARPNNPRNLYAVGVEMLKKAVDRGILNMDEWDVYCVGQNAPVIHFSTGKDSVNMGQLSWEEYAKFLTDVDLGLCLMYTPHPSYPPFDVASSGGVVLTNRMLNKQTFDLCDNVIMADLAEDAFMKGFEQAVALAKDTERRRKNYEANTIPRSWQRTLDSTIAFMEERCGNV